MQSPNLSARGHFLALVAVCGAFGAFAQTGPNNPAAAVNNPAIGVNPWSTPGNVFSSNDARATVATKGTTNLLSATDFGFSLSGAYNVTGIQLDVERSTLGPVDVALLDGWTSGLTKTVSAGTDRCLVVIHAAENGTTRQDITAMTYGGRNMTQLTEVTIGGAATFSAHLEAWILLDAELALAGSTTIVPTYAAGATLIEYCNTFSAAVFQNVDQLIPASATVTSGGTGNTNPHQLGSALATLAGSMAVNAVMTGNNTNPAVAIGGTNTYTINSGYTEGTDIYFANASMPTSGGSLQTAHKPIATGGTEQPSCTFAGDVNRHAMLAFTLQRPREVDQFVHLLKAGSLVGNNLASGTPWPTTDAYATYGGATELWGQTWYLADINASNFGATLSALVQNGTARVDHMRITVFTVSNLPIELLDFRATPQSDVVQLDWVTATEHDNDHFVVQRSRDGLTFEDIESVDGAGNSLSTLYYTTRDMQPLNGTSYYRLTQVDTDGATTSSDVVSVSRGTGNAAVYPNPSAGVFTIYDVSLRNGQVAVYTEDMRLVRTHITTGSDVQIHIEDLPDGTYVLMMRSGDEVRTERVMKVSRGSRGRLAVVSP
ncbi:MAG: T9SS type A sorting domain-containing protein [Flavobacteriales bacterium]|nr:T9SS type A sorting domain-containing protein [Flavobacteriales bacterium]